MVRHVRERMNRRRDTVEQVVIPFSDADPAVSRKRNPLRALRLHTCAFRGGPDPGVPHDPPGDVSRCRGLKRDTPAPGFGTRAGASAVKSGATALDDLR